MEDAKGEEVLQSIVSLELEALKGISELKTSSGPAAVVSQLNKSISCCIRKLEGKLKELEKVYNELDRETDRELIASKKERHLAEMKNLHTQQRRANLLCNMNLKKQTVRDREALFKATGNNNNNNNNQLRSEMEGGGGGGLISLSNARSIGVTSPPGGGGGSGSVNSGGESFFRNRRQSYSSSRFKSGERVSLLGNNNNNNNNSNSNSSKNDSAIKTSTQLTDALRNTSQMMAAQLEQSMAAIQTLADSSSTVRSTRQEYEGVTGSLSDSKKTITKMVRREQTDKVLIYLGIGFFLLTVLYIIRKRIFYSSGKGSLSSSSSTFSSSSSSSSSSSWLGFIFGLGFDDDSVDDYNYYANRNEPMTSASSFAVNG